MLYNPRLTAAITGSVILSVIPHQEPRFLLPCIPLILTCIQIPESRVWRKRFWIAWGVFNGVMSILMGVYHQGGIISAQLAMPEIIRTSLFNTHSEASHVEVNWWKTYPPSLFMLGAPSHHPVTDEIIEITTNPLLGANRTTLLASLTAHLPLCDDQQSILDRITSVISAQQTHQVLLAAPFSAWRFDSLSKPIIPPLSNFTFTVPIDHDNGEETGQTLKLTHLRTFSKHINLDDMDFGDDGVTATLSRVIGRRGLGVWRVERECVLPAIEAQKGSGK